MTADPNAGLESPCGAVSGATCDMRCSRQLCWIDECSLIQDNSKDNSKDNSQDNSMTADEQAIQGILQQIETAWNRYDSMGLAAAFAEDANFIHIFGGQLGGRAAVEAAHRNIFQTIYRGSHARFVLRSIRFLRPDVAVAFSRALVKFKEGNESREIETRPTLIVVKEQSGWRIVAFQNTKISDVPVAAQSCGPPCNLVGNFKAAKGEDSLLLLLGS